MIVAILLAVLMNAFVFVMAFVITSPGPNEVGYLYFIFTIPAGGLLIVAGLIVSLIFYFRRKDT